VLSFAFAIHFICLIKSACLCVLVFNDFSVYFMYNYVHLIHKISDRVSVFCKVLHLPLPIKLSG